MYDQRMIEEIAKELYTRERGRVVGNTRAWDDLSLSERAELIEEVAELLYSMEETWQLR